MELNMVSKPIANCMLVSMRGYFSKAVIVNTLIEINLYKVKFKKCQNKYKLYRLYECSKI